jgi:hypothetical protein
MTRIFFTRESGGRGVSGRVLGDAKNVPSHEGPEGGRVLTEGVERSVNGFEDAAGNDAGYHQMECRANAEDVKDKKEPYPKEPMGHAGASCVGGRRFGVRSVREGFGHEGSVNTKSGL